MMRGRGRRGQWDHWQQVSSFGGDETTSSTVLSRNDQDPEYRRECHCAYRSHCIRKDIDKRRVTIKYERIVSDANKDVKCLNCIHEL